MYRRSTTVPGPPRSRQDLPKVAHAVSTRYSPTRSPQSPTRCRAATQPHAPYRHPQPVGALGSHQTAPGHTGPHRAAPSRTEPHCTPPASAARTALFSLLCPLAATSCPGYTRWRPATRMYRRSTTAPGPPRSRQDPPETAHAVSTRYSPTRCRAATQPHAPHLRSRPVGALGRTR